MIRTGIYDGHTPGPWRYEMPPEEGMRIMAGDFTMVAELSHLMSNMSPETDDTGLDPDAVDARLILDAPLLLQEVKQLRRQIKVAQGVFEYLYHYHGADESEDAHWIRWFCNMEDGEE